MAQSIISLNRQRPTDTLQSGKCQILQPLIIRNRHRALDFSRAGRLIFVIPPTFVTIKSPWIWLISVKFKTPLKDSETVRVPSILSQETKRSVSEGEDMVVFWPVDVSTAHRQFLSASGSVGQTGIGNDALEPSQHGQEQHEKRHRMEL